MTEATATSQTPSAGERRRNARRKMTPEGRGSQQTLSPSSFRRDLYMKEKKMHFLGCGVSGGEEGARYGPSMMPGGSPAAWEACKPIFQAVCAKVASILPVNAFDFSLRPCLAGG